MEVLYTRSIWSLFVIVFDVAGALLYLLSSIQLYTQRLFVVEPSA